MAGVFLSKDIKMILAEYANAETTTTLAQYVAAGCFVWVAYNLVYGMKNPQKCSPIGIPDKIPLGYIDDNHIPVTMSVEEDELQSLEREVKIAKLREQLAKLKANQTHASTKSGVNPIFNDCVDALVGLGTPARKAKAEAQAIFDENPSIKTVQDFITEYGKR